jgi:hypothetical protein
MRIIVQHTLLIIFGLIVFLILYYFGNFILINTIEIKSENRWQYNYPVRYLLDFAFIFTIVGYMLFVLVKWKFHIKYLSHLLIVGLISFLLGAIILFLISGNDIKSNDFYGIKNIIVVSIEGMLVGLFSAIVLRKQ